MAYLLQSVFNGIKDIVYPNNCVICNKLVEESQNCICKGLARAWNVPYQFSLLKRVKYTDTQTDLSAIERKQNMDNAFTSTNTIDSVSIAIIDDVITTGATLSACAVELKNCGASKITGVSYCTPQFGY